MSNNLEYVLINNFKCKRCGCTHYDKLIHTGADLLEQENSIKFQQYVCRNCDFPVNINEYTTEQNITIDKNELLKQAIMRNDKEK